MKKTITKQVPAKPNRTKPDAAKRQCQEYERAGLPMDDVQFQCMMQAAEAEAERLVGIFESKKLTFERIAGCACSFVVHDMLPFIGFEPVSTCDHIFENAIHVSHGEDLDEIPLDRGVHMSGEHEFMQSRGHGLKRSKQFFQHRQPPGTNLVYKYTGRQWALSKAQRDTSVCPIVGEIMDGINNILSMQTNHAIYTKYGPEDNIDFHYDKMQTMATGPRDSIIVIKLGPMGRRFAICANGALDGNEKDPLPFWQSDVPPGAMILMSIFDNRRFKHAVPALSKAEQTAHTHSGSLVLRNIELSLTDNEIRQKITQSKHARESRLLAKSVRQ